MVDWTDKLIWTAVGCVLGYLVRLLQEILTKVEAVDKKLQDKNQDGVVRFSTMAYRVLLAAVVGTTAYAAVQTGVTNDKLEQQVVTDKVHLCEAGVETRKVQRALVDAIYDLATGAIERDPAAPPLTASEIKSYNQYIARVNEFRTSMYEQIKPSDTCAPYVDDDNVQPTTPPLSPLKPQGASA